MPLCGGGWRTPYIYYIHLFDRSISTHFIHSFDRLKEGFWRTVPRCDGHGGFHAHAVKWQWWRSEEEVGVEAAVKEAGLSSVKSGRVESGGDLESFGMKTK
jgi:hypothetical protein